MQAFFCRKLSSRPRLFSPLSPDAFLELSLESDLHYLSPSRPPQLCLFLRLNGDLDKRVWAAREQPLNTKRHAGVEESEGQWGAESQGHIHRAICTLFQTPPAAREVTVISQTRRPGSLCSVSGIYRCFDFLPFSNICMRGRIVQTTGGYITTATVLSAGFKWGCGGRFLL